ncbi:hypothetical protein DL765_011191 [Monosporascus sp. GIB2]|nr:hypothetical protein DL765_011191 [Monosporascus sp. GIB2]
MPCALATGWDKLEWARVDVLDNGLITARPRGPVDMKEKEIPEPNAATENLHALNMLQQRENMKSAPYSFWPINTSNNHYMTVIMAVGKDEAAEAERAELLHDTRHVHDEEVLSPNPFDQVLQ